MNYNKLKIEVCCYSIESAAAAMQGGADRIELCDNLFEGGTTPSVGVIKTVRDLVDIELFVMIRPRGGDFLYTREELLAMKHSIKSAKELGIDGVVLGVLNKQGSINTKAMKELIELARPLQVTIHRSFDLTLDPFQALEDAIRLGVDRILTSGQRQTAYEGINMIKSLVDIAGNSLSIMAGSGISESNVNSIVKETGVNEIHLSAKTSRQSVMDYQPNNISLGDPRFSEFTLEVADAQRIKNYRLLTSNYLDRTA